MREELYFPLFVDLTKKSIIVVGAGKIAARRVKSLLPFVGAMKVIAPEVSSEITEMAASSEGTLVIEQRPFEPSDLDGADMVLVVTNDEELNTRIGTLCNEKKILVNVSHEKELCDFYFPGVVQKDNVVIGITASGKDHSKAREVTEQIRAMMEDSK
ncbi:MAG: bifunctional precorrin-2 dehydrogenase/sirohydrochlorin ferrochelatase [Lachnospiraceae bacterium]|nr:bifunctional precorrin-2 dehydrogenase/sirohydrochlorin ferrochelatase [Lachnospiraceae bacterium]